LEEADLQKSLDSYASQLTEEDHEQLWAFSESEDKEYSDTVVEWPQLTTSVLKKCLQVVDDSFYHFFRVDHFLDRCPSFKNKMEAAVAPYTKM
jgi:hypothetical protein